MDAARGPGCGAARLAAVSFNYKVSRLRLVTRYVLRSSRRLFDFPPPAQQHLKSPPVPISFLPHEDPPTQSQCAQGCQNVKREEA